MLQSRFFAAALVAIVSIPGFLVGHELRTGHHVNALLMLPLMATVVLIVSVLMQKSESE